MAGNGLNVSISQIFFREKKSPQILQCFVVLGRKTITNFAMVFVLRAKSFAKFAMVFRPRSVMVKFLRKVIICIENYNLL